MVKLLLFVLLFAFARPAHADIHAVPALDIAKYVGTWYEIQRNPVTFEAGCVCSRQVLTLRADSKVDVLNSCNNVRFDGPARSIHGLASVEDPRDPAKLTVDFGMPWKGDYWVIALDTNYQWAVVTDRYQQSLYLLARTPTLDAATVQTALSLAAREVDTSKLQPTSQDNCTY